jgi:hypothetical protein
VTKYSALLRQIEELETKVARKQKPCLWLVHNEGDDLAAAQAKAMTDWQAAHPKAKARGVDDFDWIIWDVVKPLKTPADIPQPAPSKSPHAFRDEEEERRRRQSNRRLVYGPVGWV